MLSQLLGAAPDSTPTQPAPQPMDGVQESIQQQIADRREQLEILHGMGFNDDLHNIQVKYRGLNFDVSINL